MAIPQAHDNTSKDRDVRDSWETPYELYDKLNDVFNFQCDLAASADNTKCSLYFSKEYSALNDVRWGALPETVSPFWNFCNPPFSLKAEFIEKAADEAHMGAHTVMVLPVATETKWWNKIISPWGRPRFPIVFLTPRVNYVGVGKSGSPFPSALVLFSVDAHAEVYRKHMTTSWWNWANDLFPIGGSVRRIGENLSWHAE